MTLLRRHSIIGAAGAAGAASTLNDGVVEYYNFDELSGDLIGQVNGNNGTLVGATQGASGKIGTAYSFDGNDYVDLGDNSFFALADFTVIFSAIRNSTGDWDALGMLQGDVAGVATQRAGVFFRINKSTNKPEIILITNEGSDLTIFSTGTKTITDTNWHHYAFVKNGTGVKIYIDSTDEGGGTLMNGTVDYVSTDGQKTSIGSYGVHGAAETIFWNGSIDETYMYNRGLSSDEVLDHYNQIEAGNTYPF